VLSTLYLHAFYGLLLLWPYDLCFDYSFNCIPLLKSLSDWRNLITLAMYVEREKEKKINFNLMILNIPKFFFSFLIEKKLNLISTFS